mmetsp:Transcript_27361/g.59848  ORF Transcript_27361/g.59848 Transcript_27361/m.59848 type:complete len:101 (-) Transcript_27361:584-886(-)
MHSVVQEQHAAARLSWLEEVLGGRQQQQQRGSISGLADVGGSGGTRSLLLQYDRTRLDMWKLQPGRRLQYKLLASLFNTRVGQKRIFGVHVRRIYAYMRI